MWSQFLHSIGDRPKDDIQDLEGETTLVNRLLPPKYTHKISALNQQKFTLIFFICSLISLHSHLNLPCICHTLFLPTNTSFYNANSPAVVHNILIPLKQVSLRGVPMVVKLTHFSKLVSLPTQRKSMARA